MSLSTSRFYLEELNEERHIQGIHALWSNADNLDGSNFPVIESLENNRAWVRKRSRVSNALIENFAIMCPPGSPLYPSTSGPSPADADADAADGSGASPRPILIGFVGILRVAPPELGYLVARPYWGKGVVTEAVGVCMRHYWRAQPQVDTVYAFINEGHGASEKVAARSGFVRAPGLDFKPGSKLPNGDVVDRTVGAWELKRPRENSEP